jgi:hypothetical protein
MLASLQLSDGDLFRVSGARGVFVFRGMNLDGSVRCFGGVTGRQMWRSFPSERISRRLKPLPDKGLRRVVVIADQICL